MVFWYCLKIFSLKANNFWSFSGYCLICLLFSSNTFAWKTQWKLLCVLKDLPSDVSDLPLILWKLLLFLVWINAFILLLNHGGSLSSHTIFSWGIKLLRMLRMVLLKITTFSVTLVFKKALCQLNSSIALFKSSEFTSFIVPNLSKIGWRKVN